MICIHCNKERELPPLYLVLGICWECDLHLCTDCDNALQEPSIDNLRTIHMKTCPDRNSVELV